MEDRKNTEKRPARGPMGGGPMGMARPGEKAKDFKSGFKRLLRYLRPELPVIAAMLVLAMFSAAFSILGPRTMGNITNELQRGITSGSMDMNYIIRTAATVGVLYFASAVLSMIASFLSAGVAQKVVYRMRRDIKEKMTRLPVKYYDESSTGNLLSRITNDVDTIYNTLQQSLTQSISSAMTLIGIAVMMLTISGYLTLITLATLPLFMVVTMVIAKKSQKRFAAQQKKLGELNGYIEEVFAGQKTVKLYGTEQECEKNFGKINEQLYDAGRGAQFLAGIIMPALQFINSLGYVGVCVAGAVLAGAPGQLGIGDIQAFLQYSSQFGQPIMQTANIANTIQSTIAAAERVFQVIDAQEQVADVENPESVIGIASSVAFENVDFSYLDNVKLIENMSLSVDSCDRIAIVGPTGAGKTTMVNLLMRFYELKGGRITVGGIDTTQMKREDLRSLFGMVLQDTWLFSGTIRDNIAYGKPDATDEEVWQAARDAHVDHFISTLPEGMNTVLNEGVTNISQGQKQLLTIARAILSDPKILILDEATSSVDTRTEAYIQNAMTAMMKDKTCFIIAHRLSTIKNADLILVMNNGTIIEQGNHKELLERGGFYYELYHSQFVESDQSKIGG